MNIYVQEQYVLEISAVAMKAFLVVVAADLLVVHLDQVPLKYSSLFIQNFQLNRHNWKTLTLPMMTLFTWLLVFFRTAASEVFLNIKSVLRAAKKSLNSIEEELINEDRKGL